MKHKRPKIIDYARMIAMAATGINPLPKKREYKNKSAPIHLDIPNMTEEEVNEIWEKMKF
jgi:hypothetical protein